MGYHSGHGKGHVPLREASNSSGLILGFFFGYISRNFIYLPQDIGSVAVIGNIIPGLIANWMDRQGIIRTLSVVILTAVMVKLSVILLFGGVLFE